MVRMAQPWAMRYPLVDGQGNFGSVDGDSPAAMRYTEARMRKIADEVMADIGKNTVEFVNNFDDTLQEPSVLPTRIPLLLVNGSSGIAVGMATNMPPHNLSEVCDAIAAYIDNPDIEVSELAKYVKAPDFPTGGIIYGYEGVREALETGRGRIVMRARTEIEHTHSGRECIVVTEIPYQVNKAEMIRQIADMINEKKIDGISYINDESDRRGTRIVIILKSDAVASVVLNTLYKHSQLQTSFPVNNIALVNGRPVLLNLKDLIRHFVDHRHDVVERRTRYDLDQAEKRAHILRGLLIALDHIDEIISIIRGSQTPDIAKAALMERFGLSEVQAQAIIDMRLRALTGLERSKIEEEYAQLLERIEYYNRVLASREMRLGIVKDETLEIKEKYGDERRTEIVMSAEEFNPEDFYADDEMVITISHMGYIKRTPLAEYRAAPGRRGRQGERHTRRRLHRTHLCGLDAQHHAILHRKGTLLLAQGLQHSGGNAHLEGTRHTERHPDRTGRQDTCLHQRARARQQGVCREQLHRHVHARRHHQEDETGGLLPAPPERCQCHHRQGGRPGSSTPT